MTATPTLAGSSRGRGLLWLVTFALAAGGIMLIRYAPGVCSLWFIVSTGAQGWDVLVGSLWIITLGIGAAGILLIRYVLRNR
jgi:hypothetical protein